MGQCLSQSSGSPGAGDGAGAKGAVAKQESSSRAPPAAPSQQAVLAPKPGCKSPELYTFSSSASDATSTQPSAAHITTESSAAKDKTSQPAARASHSDARQLQAPSQTPADGRQPAASSFERKERTATPLSVLSTCVANSPSACRRFDRKPSGAEAVGAGEKQEDAAVDAEEIVVNAGGCCGPVSRRELEAKVDPEYGVFTKNALDNGLAGVPHDVAKYGAPRPANEEARMATVRALRNMGMQECPELDLILKVICRIWQAPSACVTLLDSDHVFICSAEGGFTPCHRPWAIAMCPWMLLSPHPTAMAVNDLAADARFSKSLHVAGGTRSYLTSPLVASNGHRLGAICFTDNKPRKFDAGDCRLMNNCAELAMRALESHLAVKKRLGLPAPDAKGRTRPLAKRRTSTAADGGGGRGGDLDTDDGTLMEEYANRVRDLAEADEAVVLLLDTRSPGWTILYTSPAWEALTGMDRAEALGATLNEVMAHVSGDPRVVWEGVEREAAAGKAFVTPRVYVKCRPAITFYLSFRPAASDDMDDQTVTLGVPASVPQAASASTSRLFFARLHTTPDPPANSVAQSLAPSALLTTGRRLPPSIAINPVHGLTEMFEGLVVGQVLGQGSYGTVYHARWHGVDVAIKVQDMHIRHAEERARAEFEVGLGQRLHHLNVVHTLSHASALLERSNPSGVLDSNGSNAWHAGLQFAPLGFATASRVSGPGIASARASAAPDSAEGLAMAAGPAFIPFFLGADPDAAAAAAAAATGNGDGAAAQPSLYESPDGMKAMAGGGPAAMLGDRPSYQPPVSSANAGGGAPPPLLPLAAGPTSIVSGSNAVVMLALPSGAHVPMLRSTTRNVVASTGGGGGGAAAAAAAGVGSFPQSLVAMMAARGSSRSGSPRTPFGGGGGGGGAQSVSSQGSDVVVTATANGVAAAAAAAVLRSGGEDSPSTIGSGGGSGVSAPQSARQKPSVTRFAEGAGSTAGRRSTAVSGSLGTVAASVAAAAAAQGYGSAGGASGCDGSAADGADADGGMTLVPFLTSSALAAARASVADEIGGVAAPDAAAGAAAAAGGGGSPQLETIVEGAGGLGSAAAVSAADCTSLGKAGFGSALQCSSCTRGSTTTLALATGPHATNSAFQNLAASTVLPQMPSSIDQSSPPPPKPDAAAATGQKEEDEKKLQQRSSPLAEPAAAAAPPKVAAPKVPSGQPPLPRHVPPTRQPSALMAPHNHQSGAMALSGAYPGMPLLPYMDGGATAFGSLASGALARLAPGSVNGATAMAAGGSVGGGVATTMQGAIGADLSGLSYPLDVRLWMVLEFMDKGSLQDAIDRGWLREGRTADHGPDYPAVLATAQEIAAAVAHLHSHDVVHGDLSAVNVLLQSVRQQGEPTSRRAGGAEASDPSGRGFIAKISDFGLSMQLKRPDEAIKTGAYGTITHMAPEVLRDSALSKPGDVYSVGVLLWQMATGSRPWAGLSHLQVSVEVGTNLRQLAWPAWVHAGVRALGQRCMAPQPADRPTAAQLAAELTELLKQVPQYG